MIDIVLDADGLDRAFQLVAAGIDGHLRTGLEATLESIAARAKETTTFVDRTGALRNSIQSNGVTDEGGTLVGVVSFAAVSQARSSARRRRGGGGSAGGFPYGLAQEFGTRTGVREKRFIRDAIDAEDGDLLEGSLKAAFRAAGFEVS